MDKRKTHYSYNPSKPDMEKMDKEELITQWLYERNLLQEEIKRLHSRYDILQTDTKDQVLKMKAEVYDFLKKLLGRYL